MDDDAFCEALLAVMERKEHWAWPAFTSGEVSSKLLHLHLEQEYEVYVRDFPILVGRAFVQCPVAVVRQELAANLYEEETGGLAAGRPHPELFLEYPRGLGMDLARFDVIELLPAARIYRDFLDEVTTHHVWAAAVAVVTLFIEGTKYDRNVLDASAPARPEPRLEDHPLVKHYGLPVAHLALTKAHRQIEGTHRDSGWRCVLDHTPSSDRILVVSAMQDALRHWKGFRDDVAAACGVQR